MICLKRKIEKSIAVLAVENEVYKIKKYKLILTELIQENFWKMWANIEMDDHWLLGSLP